MATDISTGARGSSADASARPGRQTVGTNRTAYQRNFLLILLTSLLATGCQRAAPVPLSAGELLGEYEQSMAGARQKYDGREISVQGFACAAASLPGNADQGSLWLQATTEAAADKIGCWFSRQQAADFSQIRMGQHLTIKGVFNGESGVQLKFCRLVKGE